MLGNLTAGGGSRAWPGLASTNPGSHVGLLGSGKVRSPQHGTFCRHEFSPIVLGVDHCPRKTDTPDSRCFFNSFFDGQSSRNSQWLSDKRNRFVMARFCEGRQGFRSPGGTYQTFFYAFFSGQFLATRFVVIQVNSFCEDLGTGRCPAEIGARIVLRSQSMGLGPCNLVKVRSIFGSCDLYFEMQRSDFTTSLSNSTIIILYEYIRLRV